MSSLSADWIYDISNKYEFYSSIFILIIGLFSNISLVLIFVTLRIFRNNKCAFFLTVESIANIGLFLGVFPANIFAYITGNDPVTTSPIWCKLLSMISQVCAQCSLFSICFVAFDQFLSTNPRHSWRKLSSSKLAHRLTFFNVLFVILHSTLYLIFTDIGFPYGCSVFNPAAKAYLTYFYQLILTVILPLVSTSTFSFLAYRNVRRIVRRQASVMRRRLDRQLTAMVLTRVVCLILLGLPSPVFSLYELNLNFTEDNQMEIAIVSLVSSVVLSLLNLNFAINFYLFLIVSTRFRRQVKHFLVKNCWNSLKGFCHSELTNTNRNRVAPETIHGNVSSVESG